MKKPQLFLLHFAGGNCYSFQFLTPLLNDFEVTSLELPGRGRRVGENLLYEFDEAARDLYEQIRARLHSGVFVIYGHSMGAYLTLRVANMLEKEGRPPVCILVSGNAGPGIRATRKVYMLEREEFIRELELLGGVSRDIIDNEELFGFFEPILRADFEIVEKNELGNEPPVNTPLLAMMGSKEQDADKISNWGRFTRMDFNYEILDGDHFFIHKHPRKIADMIKKFSEKHKA